jgi:dihydrofolate reductase
MIPSFFQEKNLLLLLHTIRITRQEIFPKIGTQPVHQTLMHYGLIDEYRIMLYPVVVGKGKHLFKDGIDTTAFKLVGTKTFSAGVIILCYQPAIKEDKK